MKVDQNICRSNLRSIIRNLQTQEVPLEALGERNIFERVWKEGSWKQYDNKQRKLLCSISSYFRYIVVKVALLCHYLLLKIFFRLNGWRFSLYYNCNGLKRFQKELNCVSNILSTSVFLSLLKYTWIINYCIVSFFPATFLCVLSIQKHANRSLSYFLVRILKSTWD